MLYTIDGGPCTGKTTVLHILRDAGYTVVREAARGLIRKEQQEARRNPEYRPTLPTTNFRGFQHAVARITLERIIRAQEHGAPPIFTDRHLPSQIAYMEEAGMEVPTVFYQMIAQYAPARAFLLEQLPFQNDHERHEDQETARRLHERVIHAYERIGADIIHVPVMPSYTERAGAALRAAYIRQRLLTRVPGEELERTFHASHANIRERLDTYHTRLERAGREDTWVRPEQNGYTRVRKTDGTYTVTRTTHTKDQEAQIEREQSAMLPQLELDTMIHYTNHREEYRLIGDPNSLIRLDRIAGLGEFVEIAAGSTEQLDAIQQRLGIREEAIRTAYWELRAA